MFEKCLVIEFNLSYGQAREQELSKKLAKTIQLKIEQVLKRTSAERE